MLRKLAFFMGVLAVTLLAACGGGEGASAPDAPAGLAGGSQPARQRLAYPPASSAGGLGSFFALAASTYPQYFSGGTQDGTISVDGYGTFSYRHFASGNYLAVLDGSVYAYGGVTNNTILRVGALDDFTCSVYPGNLGCAQLDVAGVRYGSLASMDDQAEYTIYLYAGLPYAFTATSVMFDTYLSLYSSGGAFVKANNDTSSGTNSLVLYTPSTSGLYRLRVNAASGSGAFSVNAYFQGAIDSPSFIDWPGSTSAHYINDSTQGDNFSFDATSRCLYSWNRNEVLTNFCLDPGSSSGTFAGQPVQVILIGTDPANCSAALADPWGLTIDIDTTGMIPKVTKTNFQWATSGCT